MATENLGANENKKAGEGAKRPRPADGKTPVKKKKIIIVTGNSNKGRQGSGQRSAYSSGSYSSGSAAGSYSSGGARKQRPAGQAGGARRDTGAARPRTEAKPVPHKIIRPSVKPTQMEVDFHKPEPVVRRPKKVEETPVAAVEVKTAAQEPVVQEIVQPAEPVVEKAAETPAAPAVLETPVEKKAAEEPVREEVVAAVAPAVEEKPAPVESPASSEVKPTEEAVVKEAATEHPVQPRQDQPERAARQQSGQRGRDNRDNRDNKGAFQRDRNSQGQQGGFRGGRSERTGDQGGFRTNRGEKTGDQGSFAGRSARPGQGRGAAAPAAARQGSRPGAAESGRRRSSGRPEGEGFAEKHRDDNKRKMNQERDKRSRKDLIYNEEDTRKRGNANRAGRFIRPEKKVETAVEEQIKTITIPEKLTIRELAEAMHMNPSEIIKKLFLAGQVMTPNSEVEYDEAEKIALDYDILCEKEQKVDVIEELLREEDDAEEDMETRPPVICVMGHVDHGKTSLLDAIRKTNVTRGEAGGITQAIGAYTIKLDDRSITFLDTPGHEAFTAMRMRGANSTDIAVLVVAADDGVMPQTIEAINHAKAAGVEIIVAVNKIDKPGANVERVKQEMTEYELVPTDWGGTTEFVPVSAKTGEGIEDLLETILLTADILELKANPNRKARGLVLEAKLDKGRGPVANVLVQKGTLHIGDFISAGASSGKVRAMIDDKGRRIKEAKPSQPVEILGLSDVPSAGEVIIAHESNDEAKAYAETYKNQHKEELIEDTKMRMNLDDLFNQMKEGNLKEFNLIIKADVQGSVEALKQSLLKLSNEEVVVKVIHGGVGAITESDVTLASASNAVIIGFNVRPDATAKAMAEHEGVDIRLYKVIYQAIDAVEAALKGMLAPVYEERVIGHVVVRQLFKASSVGNIAGSYVLDGVIRRGCKCRISRAGEQIFEGDLASLKRFKDDVKEVKAGFECGLVFEGFDKMQVDDLVEAYDLVEVPRT